jgi:hypothetical protein
MPGRLLNVHSCHIPIICEWLKKVVSTAFIAVLAAFEGDKNLMCWIISKLLNTLC